MTWAREGRRNRRNPGNPIGPPVPTAATHTTRARARAPSSARAPAVEKLARHPRFEHGRHRRLGRRRRPQPARRHGRHGRKVGGEDPVARRRPRGRHRLRRRPRAAGGGASDGVRDRPGSGAAPWTRGGGRGVCAPMPESVGRSVRAPLTPRRAAAPRPRRPAWTARSSRAFAHCRRRPPRMRRAVLFGTRALAAARGRGPDPLGALLVGAHDGQVSNRGRAPDSPARPRVLTTAPAFGRTFSERKLLGCERRGGKRGGGGSVI